jgi:hypothetical protein
LKLKAEWKNTTLHKEHYDIGQKDIFQTGYNETVKSQIDGQYRPISSAAIFSPEWFCEAV